ncbi:MAG: molecular chaperone TorD family protein [Desulfobulbus sp.]|nr:molecular chaperone TorD family protein [Desulfobulbus sp.]
MTPAEQAAAWRALAAEDLSLLARLHGVELDAETLAALKAAEFPGCLTLPPATREGEEARLLMAEVVAGEDAAFAASLDELAADYAAIYLTGRYHASPNESAWLDEDGLERQEPMFAVRAWYQKYNLGAGDWRKRQDDNLSLQLQFIAHLCTQATDDAALRPLADFLDAHPLRWLDRFAERVASRAATPFYAALGMLTADYLHGLRAALVVLADAPWPPPAEEVRPEEEALSNFGCGDAIAFVPGAGPTW